MKQPLFIKKILGVTLLEILLVLAIAGLIIVVSIRYYASATASQQANTAFSMASSITAAADNLAASSGSYSAAGVSSPTIQPLMPNRSLTTPWNTTVTITNATATTYRVTFPATPVGVCPLLLQKVNGSSDNHYSSASTCSSTAATDLIYNYDSRGG